MTVSRNGENAAIEVLNLPWFIGFFYLPLKGACTTHWVLFYFCL
jgi:hypothetical protein